MFARTPLLIAAAFVISALAAPTRRSNVGDGELSFSFDDFVSQGSLYLSGTFFAPGLGSCGVSSTDADLIVAISSTLFQSVF
jgi:hypothetical protein